MSNFELNEDLDFSTVECCSCGVMFAMPQVLNESRLKDKNAFFCPNGHSQVYTGKTQAEKKVEELQKAIEESSNIIRTRGLVIQGLEGSISSYKGQVTKLRNKLNK